MPQPSNRDTDEPRPLPDLPSVWEEPPARYEQEHLPRNAPDPSSPYGANEPASPFGGRGPAVVGCSGGNTCCVFPCFGCAFLVVLLLSSFVSLWGPGFSGGPDSQPGPPSEIPPPREHRGPLPPPR